MKKFIAILMCLSLLVAFSACGSQPVQEKEASSSDEVETLSAVTSPDEYSAYQDVFYSDKADDYKDKEFTKAGTFTVLYDYFNDVTRYYIWGYNKGDNGEDWQWEIKLNDESSAPAAGDLIEVTGKFESDEAALDGYWLTDPVITVKEKNNSPKYDIDMVSMSPTLERVQISNIQNYKDKNAGKTVALYGVIVSENLVRHPYSEESWQMHFSTEEKIPEEGTRVIISGTFNDGIIEGASVSIA